MWCYPSRAVSCRTTTKMSNHSRRERWESCRAQTFHYNSSAGQSRCSESLGFRRPFQLLWKNQFTSADVQPPHDPLRSAFRAVCESGFVFEGAHWNAVHVVLRLICQESFSGTLWRDPLKKKKMFITPTYRETDEQPNLQLPGPRLQQTAALLTFTAQCPPPSSLKSTTSIWKVV